VVTVLVAVVVSVCVVVTLEVIVVIRMGGASSYGKSPSCCAEGLTNGLVSANLPRRGVVECHARSALLLLGTVVSKPDGADVTVDTFGCEEVP